MQDTGQLCDGQRRGDAVLLTRFMERTTAHPAGGFSRLLILCGLLIFPGAWCHAETAASNPALESLSCKLPAQLDDLFFYVEAEIGGERSLNLVLDTGASFSVISTGLAKRLKTRGALRDRPDRFGGTASRRRQKMDFVEISDVKLGELHLATETAVVLDLTMLSGLSGRHVDGVAGMSLFSNVVLVLDYPGKEVRIEPRNSPLPEGARRAEGFFHTHQPYVTLEVGRQRVTALVDSGYTDLLSVPRLKDQSAFVAPPVVTSSAVTATEIVETRSARLAGNLEWAGVTFERPIADISRREFGMIGRKALENFVVVLDQSQQRIVLVPSTNRVASPPPYRTKGLSLSPTREGLEVMGVAPNTQARRAGIRRGDVVLSINGEPAANWDARRLRDSKSDTNTFDLEVVRGRKKRAVKLAPQILVE